MSKEVLIFGGSAATDEFELLDEKRKSLLPIETIKSNLQDFMQSVHEIVPTIASAGGYGLKTVQVAVGINGKGQVGFLGVGGELGGTATLTLTFERAAPQGAGQGGGTQSTSAQSAGAAPASSSAGSDPKTS